MPKPFILVSSFLLFPSLFDGGKIPLTCSVGDTVILPCDVPSNSSEHVVAWHKVGIVVPIFVRFNAFPPHIEEAFQGRLKSASDPTFLEINEVKGEDGGTYQCSIVFFGSSDGRGVEGTSIELIVLVPPTLTEASPSFLAHKPGETVDLMCIGDGMPKPKISWLKDGSHVSESSRLSISLYKITIALLESSDAGTYTCVLENASGKASHSVKLVVEGKTHIVTPPRNMTVALGSRVKLECQAEGLPGNITYRWFFNSEDVETTPGLLERSGIYADGSFVITSAMKSDIGWYKCQSTNGLGAPSSAQAFLNVTYLPQTLKMPSKVYVIRGLRAELECPADANPPVTSTGWTKNGVAVEFPGPSTWVSSSGSLMFDQVHDSDQGNYSCLPHSPIGHGGSSSIVQVVVKEAPYFTARPDFFLQKRPGQTVELNCASQSDPPASNSWKKVGDLKFPEGGRIEMEGGNVTIKNVLKEDQGTYECHASNAIATSVASIILLVQEKEFHGAYRLNAIGGDNSATLSWLPAQSFGGRHNYVVWFRHLSDGNTSWQTLRVVPEGALSTTLYGLGGGKDFEFMVQSRDEFDREDFSEVVVVRTKGSTSPAHDLQIPQAPGITTYPRYNENLIPPTESHGMHVLPPHSLRGQMTSQGLNLSWMHSNAEDNVSHYSIYYRTVGKWVQLADQLPANASNFLWSTASRGTVYQFSMYSHQGETSSNASSIAIVDTSDEPPRPSFHANLVIFSLAPASIMAVIFIVLVSRTRRKNLRRRKCDRYGTIKYFGPNQADENRLRMSNKSVHMEGPQLSNSSNFKETPI